MYENENTETADSHHKNEELFEELSKYWRLVINHMGSDYSHLIKLSNESEAVELLQSLYILEQTRVNDQPSKVNQDLAQELIKFQKQITQQRQELGLKTQQIYELLKQQTYLQQQNQELIKQLAKKEEENSRKIEQLQKELTVYICQRDTYKIPSTVLSARTTMQQFSQSTKSSPQPREFRQLSSFYQTSLRKLTKVQGAHNKSIQNYSNIIQ